MNSQGKMKRVKKWLLVLFFFVTASIPLLFLALGIDSPHFASEQRPLPPQIKVEGAFNTQFTNQFDDYWSRSFPLNSLLVSRYNWLTGTLLQSSTNPKVMWGRDGYLFFKETLSDALKAPTLSDDDLSKIYTSLRLQAEYAASQGASFHFLIAPNKASIYPEYLPTTIQPVYDLSNATRLLNRIIKSDSTIHVLDLFSLLDDLKDREDETIYHRLDSHWNHRGAFAAYEQLMLDMGFKPLTIHGPRDMRQDFLGDLSTMYYPDREVLDWQVYATDFEEKYVPLRPIRTLEDLTIETMRPDKKGSLLMYRDSFANALIPYLSSSIGQATYVRQTKYDYRLLDRKQPEAVVVQIVERNLDWLLQGTPIMAAPDVQLPPIAGTLELAFELEQSESSGMTFINGRFLDDLSYDRVIVAAENSYEAFPLFDDGSVDDHLWHPGFSLYIKAPMQNMTVYVQSDGAWYEVQPVSR